MRYGRLTIEVLFEHGDNVPVTVAAERIIHRVQHGNVVALSGAHLEPATERDVIEARGGCGECETCQGAIDEMVMPGYSRTAPAEAENAAIERAQGA